MITYLLTHLAADVTLAALVSTRIRPGMLEQGATLPAVTYTLVSRVPAHHRSGPDTLGQSRWQFDCHARTYTEVVAVCAALMADAQEFTHTTAPRVDRVFVDAVRDLNTGDFDEGLYFRRTVDLLIWHEEP